MVIAMLVKNALIASYTTVLTKSANIQVKLGTLFSKCYAHFFMELPNCKNKPQTATSDSHRYCYFTVFTDPSKIV